MRYISSDTNIWIDFFQIDRIELPFRLPYTYCMSSDAIRDELLSPVGCSAKLVSLGLHAVDLDDGELSLVIEYGNRYRKLSVYDRVALAIAKKRSIVLLSGDMALRRAAKQENVEVRGTLWILDQLLETQLISEAEFKETLRLLDTANGIMVRLPAEEIRKRLNR